MVAFITWFMTWLILRSVKPFLLSGRHSALLFRYTGNNDGLFISPRIAASIKKIPLSLFFQATQPLTTNIEPNPGFRWNAGLAYMF